MIATWIASGAAVIALIFGGIGLSRQIKSTTEADRDRAAQRVNDQITAARKDEQEKCRERVASLESRLSEMTSDRNSERDRANRLQDFINMRGLGGMSP
jgi:hypothetical protein